MTIPKETITIQRRRLIETLLWQYQTVGFDYDKTVSNALELFTHCSSDRLIKVNLNEVKFDDLDSPMFAFVSSKGYMKLLATEQNFNLEPSMDNVRNGILGYVVNDGQKTVFLTDAMDLPNVQVFTDGNNALAEDEAWIVQDRAFNKILSVDYPNGTSAEYLVGRYLAHCMLINELLRVSNIA